MASHVSRNSREDYGLGRSRHCMRTSPNSPPPPTSSSAVAGSPMSPNPQESHCTHPEPPWYIFLVFHAFMSRMICRIHVGRQGYEDSAYDICNAHTALSIRMRFIAWHKVLGFLLKHSADSYNIRTFLPRDLFTYENSRKLGTRKPCRSKIPIGDVGYLVNDAEDHRATWTSHDSITVAPRTVGGGPMAGRVKCHAEHPRYCRIPPRHCHSTATDGATCFHAVQNNASTVHSSISDKHSMRFSIFCRIWQDGWGS